MAKNRDLIILLYHGVTDASPTGIANYSGKHVPVAMFDEHMRILKQNCTLLTIDDVVTHTEQGDNWPENAVVVTFDDGFKNNYHCAAPVLQKYNIPAVFYICAGMVGTDRMFWVDQIEDCINRTSRAAIEIELEAVHRLELNTPAAKIAAVESIKQFCKRVPADVKNRVIADLVTCCGITPSVTHSTNYQMMSWDEVTGLDRNPLFTIGGHTLYHDIMSARPVEAMEQDVKETLALLENKLGHSVSHFAYPEGQAHHYSQSVIHTLKNHGIICCPSAMDGTNPPGTDLFHLKRIMPGFMKREFPVF